MKVLVLLLLCFSVTSFSFEGIVTYSVSESLAGKKISSAGKKVVAYFKDDSLVRLFIEFDRLRSVQLSEDFYFSHKTGKVTVIDESAKKYSEFFLDKDLVIKDEHKGFKLGSGKVIKKYETTIYSFENKATAKKIEIHYANTLKVKPTPYLVSRIGSMVWGVHPDTGAIAMKFDLILENGVNKVIEVSSIESKKLKPSDYLPSLTNLEIR
jgi:hypothetical protein